MKGVYECRVIGHSEVSPGVIRTLFECPEIAQGSRAGQFVNVQVARTTDPLLRRPISIHSVFPNQGLFSLMYVLVGRGTKLLSKLQPGESVSIVGPLGRGFDIGDSGDAEHILVAGGCGAAPLHFLCDELCERWDCNKVKVLSGGRNKEAVLCESEFKSHDVDMRISTDDGSYGHHGFVTELLQEYLSGKTSEELSRTRIYACGPHLMMKEVARVSHEARVGICQVSLENVMACGIGVCTGCVQKIKGAVSTDKSGRDWHYERVCKDGPVFNAEDVIWE